MWQSIALSELTGENVEQKQSITTPPPPTFPWQGLLDHLRELAIDQLRERRPAAS